TEEATAANTTNGAQTGQTSFALEMATANPLVSGAPDIDSTLSGSVAGNGALTLSYQTDLFPSHGIAVSRNDDAPWNVIVNDASCLSSGDVRGIGGMARVAAGLAHPDNQGAITWNVGNAGTPAQTIPSQLCNRGYWGV